MRAKYVGNTDLPEKDRDLPDTFEMMGVVFEKGKSSEIPPELEAKFLGNSHFETSGKETDAK